MSQITVIVGRIGRPHGVRGELTVEPRTDEPDRRFAVGAELIDETAGADSRTWEVTGSRWHSGRLLIRLAGVMDRNTAEELRGTIVSARVTQTEQPAEDGEFYDRHLIGLEVRIADRPVGTIRNVVHGAQDLLEVRTDAGVRLVPFVAALVPVVDVNAGYCEVVDLPGLLEGEADEG